MEAMSCSCFLFCFLKKKKISCSLGWLKNSVYSGECLLNSGPHTLHLVLGLQACTATPSSSESLIFASHVHCTQTSWKNIFCFEQKFQLVYVCSIGMKSRALCMLDKHFPDGLVKPGMSRNREQLARRSTHFCSPSTWEAEARGIRSWRSHSHNQVWGTGDPVS